MIATDAEIAHFLAIYAKRHVTRASVGLNISQPALTQSIARLERKLKAKLFDRSKSGCKPTAVAELLFTKINRLQECWADIEVAIAETQEGLRGKFRLGCHASVGAYTLPRFFKTMDRAAPEIDVQLKHDFSRNITESILRFELDLGFVINPVRHPDLVLTKLGTDRICFWRNPKAERIPKILFSDLSDHELKNSFGLKTLRSISDWKRIETPSLELVRTLVIRGAGMGILPERVAGADQTGLERIADLPIRTDEIYLAYRMDTLKSAAGKAVIGAARGCISNQ
jgi:DNA-binding transcriptional LysR family regulator